MIFSSRPDFINAFLIIAVCVIGGAMRAGVAAGHAASTLPDTFVARLEALASMETLNAELLASHSATSTLEGWCATHAMADNPKIVAVRVFGQDKPANAAQRHRLQVGPTDELKYRRVRLSCGNRVLSEADNWYVPARLTAAMNEALETTQIPFGKVVALLKPTRQTIAADLLWTVLPPGWELGSRPADHPDAALEIPPVLFEHHAVLYDADHRPISEVYEHYTRDILRFDQPR